MQNEIADLLTAARARRDAEAARFADDAVAIALIETECDATEVLIVALSRHVDLAEQRLGAHLDSRAASGRSSTGG